MNLFYANSIRALHIGILLFIVFGSLSPMGWLPAHLILIAIVVLHWWSNKGQCVLTQLENRFRGQPTVQAEGQFIKRVFGAVGMEPSRALLFIVIYGIIAASAALSLKRLWLEA